MTSILIFLVVLGLLIFFHELGHFVAAKACGIYCDRFSLGMPPRVFGVRLGETDYCVGLLPIGGYVKMAGQEDVPLSEEERDAEFGHVPPERWYMNQPVWQRMIVIAAGPLMNVVLAVLLYAIVAGMGADVPESTVDNRIGSVRADSPAAEAQLYRVMDAEETPGTKAEPDAFGWQTGDRILSINGKRVDGFVDVAFGAVLSGGDPVRVIIERALSDGTSALYASTVVPEHIEGSEVAQFGVAPFNTALIGAVVEGSPAEAAGLQPDDIITRMNGKTIDQTSLIETLATHTQGDEVEVEVLRDGHTLSVSMTPESKGKVQDIVFDPPRQWMSRLEQLETLTVTHEDSDALRDVGLKQGDTINRIGDAEANAELLRGLAKGDMARRVDLTVTRKTGLFGLGGTEELTLSGVSLQDTLQAVTPFDILGQPRIAGISDEAKKTTGLQRDDVLIEINGRPATITNLRDEEQANANGELTVKAQRPAIAGGAVQQEEILDATIPVAQVGQIGVIFGTKMVFHKATPGQILPEAIRLTWRDVDRIILTIQKLVTGGLSPKNLGGPVMIFNVTTEAAQHGLNWLLKITAFISVNLAIFNLLPLPVLDGGHLVFLTVEAIRRKPAHPKLLEWVQQAGVVLIIFLILFVTYNDIRRIVVDFLP